MLYHSTHCAPRVATRKAGGLQSSCYPLRYPMLYASVVSRALIRSDRLKGQSYFYCLFLSFPIDLPRLPGDVTQARWHALMVRRQATLARPDAFMARRQANVVSWVANLAHWYTLMAHLQATPACWRATSSLPLRHVGTATPAPRHATSAHHTFLVTPVLLSATCVAFSHLFDGRLWKSGGRRGKAGEVRDQGSGIVKGDGIWSWRDYDGPNLR